MLHRIVIRLTDTSVLGLKLDSDVMRDVVERAGYTLAVSKQHEKHCIMSPAPGIYWCDYSAVTLIVAGPEFALADLVDGLSRTAVLHDSLSGKPVSAAVGLYPLFTRTSEVGDA